MTTKGKFKGGIIHIAGNQTEKFQKKPNVPHFCASLSPVTMEGLYVPLVKSGELSMRFSCAIALAQYKPKGAKTANLITAIGMSRHTKPFRPVIWLELWEKSESEMLCTRVSSNHVLSSLELVSHREDYVFKLAKVFCVRGGCRPFGMKWRPWTISIEFAMPLFPIAGAKPLTFGHASMKLMVLYRRVCRVEPS